MHPGLSFEGPGRMAFPDYQNDSLKNYLPKAKAVHRKRHKLPIKDIEREAAETPNQANLQEKPNKFSLLALANDYVFFTTGVLACSVRHERDMVREFALKYPDVPEAMPFAIDYPDRFFTGFPRPTDLPNNVSAAVNYNCRIYGIAKNRWLLLRDMLASTAFADLKNGYYARINYYELDLVDPFEVRRQRVMLRLPTVKCFVFGYSSTVNFAYIQPMPFPALPRYTLAAPKPDVALERDTRMGKIKKL
jgi:hypothetical protein